jgi:hypothetical protein
VLAVMNQGKRSVRVSDPTAADPDARALSRIRSR